MLIVFAAGALMVIQFYVPHPWSVATLEESNRWVRIIRNFALLLGVASLISSHWRKVSRKQAGYGYSLMVFLSFALMVVLGLVWGIDAPRDVHMSIPVPAETALAGGEVATGLEIAKGDKVTLSVAPGEPAPSGGLQGAAGEGGKMAFTFDQPVKFSDRGQLVLDIPAGAAAGEVVLLAHLEGGVSPGFWLFDRVKVSMEASMYSLLAFFISSAAFRAFRARSFDAMVMLITAILMMLAQVPFGDMISMWFSKEWLVFPEVRSWILDVPMMAAKRAIFLGIALSIIATSIRIIFGLERSYLGRGE